MQKRVCHTAGRHRAHGSLLPGGQLQPSLHLTALVQLVKEIPEFLFGETKGAEDGPESEGASLDGDTASLQGKTESKGGLRSLSVLHKVKVKSIAPHAVSLPAPGTYSKAVVPGGWAVCPPLQAPSQGT